MFVSSTLQESECGKKQSPSHCGKELQAGSINTVFLRLSPEITIVITICNHPEIVGILSQLRLSNRSATLIKFPAFEGYPTQH
jgi:hypothetical protein